MRRTHHLWRHLNRANSLKPIFSYNRITDKLCGSPAWKHTFTRGYTSSVGVQHGNTHSHKRIFKLCGSPALTQVYIQALWESNMETHIHTGYASGRGSPAWKHTFTQENIHRRRFTLTWTYVPAFHHS